MQKSLYDIMDKDRIFKRSLFDSAADYYNATRPSYPRGLVNNLIFKTGITANSQVLEIGTGTGQLTLELAKRGINLHGIEIGRKLAEITAHRVFPYINATIETGDFETMKIDVDSYDLIVFATSYKWLDPSRRVELISSVLRNNGCVAIIETHHVNGGTKEFFADSQDCYRLRDNNTKSEYHLPEINDIQPRLYGSEFNGRFHIQFSRFYQEEKHILQPIILGCSTLIQMFCSWIRNKGRNFLIVLHV